LAVSISGLYFFNCNIHYKDVVKFSSVGQKSSYVLLALAPLCSYSEISTCGLRVMASALALASRRFGLD